MKAAEDAVVKITAGAPADRRRATEGDSVRDDERGVRGRSAAAGAAREDLHELFTRRRSARRPRATTRRSRRSSAAREALQKSRQRRLREIRSDIREMARRRSELEGARDRARSVGYDDPRGTLGNGGNVLGQVIGGILQGAIQGGALDRVLRDNYNAPKRRADPNFGSGGRTPPWPNSWGGGGNDRGGEWRTGGSF